MTYEFEYLLSLVGAAAVRRKIDLPEKEIDWDKLFCIASDQVVYALAASAAKDIMPKKENNIRKEIRNKLVSIVVSEEIRLNAVLELVQYLEKENISFALLKGYSIAALYETPELRESGDVDIYVGKQFEKRAIALLRKRGVAIKKRNPSQHESVGYHPIIGPIEIHAHLFREEDRKVWFGRSQEFKEEVNSYMRQTISKDITIPVLSVQDNVVFLCLHFIKHFIREGVSLRNIIDLGLFFDRNYKEIKFSDLWRTLCSLNYENVIQAVLNICVEYFGFEIEKFEGYNQISKEVICEFLDDVEKGGNFGCLDMKNRHEVLGRYEKYIYENEANSKKDKKWKRRRILWERIYAIKFDKEKLITRYKYARKNPLLLLVAWIHHVIVSVGKLVKISCSKQGTCVEKDNARIKLFRDLNIKI